MAIKQLIVVAKGMDVGVVVISNNSSSIRSISRVLILVGLGRLPRERKALLPLLELSFESSGKPEPARRPV